jgi:hypothetical protein
MSASTPGSYATLVKSGGGIININGSSFKDIHVSPVGTFFATNTKDLGGNLGISFSSGSFMAFF